MKERKKEREEALSNSAARRQQRIKLQDQFSILSSDLSTPVARQHISVLFVPVAVSVVFSPQMNCYKAPT